MSSATDQGWRPLDWEAEKAWLRERTPSSGPNSAGSTTGYEPDGYEHGIWVLHAMYEPVDWPVPAVAINPDDIAATWGELRERSSACTVSTSHRSESRTPTPGLAVRWAELAARRGSNFQGQQYPPCFRWFPDEGWPDNLLPPTEGSLDQPTATRLIARLANASSSPECIAAYSFLAVTGQTMRIRASSVRLAASSSCATTV